MNIYITSSEVERSWSDTWEVQNVIPLRKVNSAVIAKRRAANKRASKSRRENRKRSK